MSIKIGRVAAAVVLAGLLTGCVTNGPATQFETPAQTAPDTLSTGKLEALPPPERRIPVAVYEFADLTGQTKPNSRFAETSRAITQGGVELLTEALLRAGNGEWFDVIERRGLNNVLKERKIIQATRSEHKDPEKLDPMNFAGVILEGGIIAYESNLATGGAGARYLGIGGTVEYQVDRVTTSLRAVSVQSGRVLASVTTTKEIYSTLLQFSVFKYASIDSLLEIETGVTHNQPPQFAVREAIELSVMRLIERGVEEELWAMRDGDDEPKLASLQVAKAAR